MYGIFDLKQNYKLLRYSTQQQAERIYEETDPVTKTLQVIHELCLPDIEYSAENIGKNYDPATGIFS